MIARLALPAALAALLAVPSLSWVRDARAGDPVQVDASEAHVARLIRDLGADSFDARTKATEALQKLGARAVPALRKAMKEADSEEVRWRAEQLLLRIEGAKSEPLGSDQPDEPKAEDPLDRLRRLRGWRPGTSEGRVEDIFKSLQEHMKQLDKRFEDLRRRSDTNSNLDALGGLMGRAGSLAVPGLRLDTVGPGRVRLRVESDSGSSPATYEGSTLQDILTKHPTLRDHAQMKALQEKTKSGAWSRLSDLGGVFEMLKGLRNGQTRIGVEFDKNGKLITRHVQIEKTETGTKVKITEKDADGKETVTEVEGESLEAIKRDNPALKDKLGGVRIRLSLPQVFLGDDQRKRKGRLELFPFKRPTTPSTQKPVFGVGLDPVSESLAAQLGLEDARGMIIGEVLPGSAAEKIGLRRYDILLSVDDTVVTPSNAAVLLGAKVDPATPVRLEIMRRAARQTLTR